MPGPWAAALKSTWCPPRARLPREFDTANAESFLLEPQRVAFGGVENGGGSGEDDGGVVMDDKCNQSLLMVLAEINQKLAVITDNSTELIQKTILLHMAESRDSACRERASYFVKLIGHQYEAATKYSKIVVMGGYAAFFAIWSSIHEPSIPKNVSLISAVLMGISIFIFCIFEVYKMYVGTKLHSVYSDGASKIDSCIESCSYADVYKEIGKVHNAIVMHDLSLVKVWKWNLYGALFFAISGVMLFLFGIIYRAFSV